MTTRAADAGTRSLSGRSFAVIGAGIVGLSLARALRGRGADVLLVEARRAGGGASGAAAGILPQPSAGRSQLARFTRAAHAGYPRFVAEIEAESGVAVGLKRCGSAYVALSAEEEGELRSGLSELEGHGSPPRWLDPPALWELAPGSSDSARGGLFLPDTMWVSPPRLVAALRESCVRRGVDLREGERAEIAPSAGSGPGNGGCDLLLSGGSERISGREVLVAAGAWSGELLHAAGLSPPAALQPIRGQMIECPHAGRLSTVLDWGEIYLIPAGEGTVWVGATVEEAGFEEEVTPDGVSWLLESARKVLPALGPPRRAWAGLRPKLLRRGGPLLGEGSPPVLAGHYRSGIHLGPLTAHLLASRLAGEDPPDLTPFEL